MKKRLLCLVLCLLMALPLLLTGCKPDEGFERNLKLRTITLCLIANENTTEAGIQAVESALNNLIEPSYDVHIDIQCYSEEEYYSVIDHKLVEYEKEQASKRPQKPGASESGESDSESLTEALTTAADETTGGMETYGTYLDEDGDPHYIFPEATENQIDIFLVTDAGKFLEYATTYEEESTVSKYLYDMTSVVSNRFPELFKTINPNLISASTVNGSLYAIPNNRAVGEYTYLLINKDICTDQLYWAGNEFQTLESLPTYLKAVETYCPDAIPLYNLPDYPLYQLTDEFLLIGTIPDPTAVAYSVENLLTNKKYTDYLTQCYNLRKNNWVTEGSSQELPADQQVAAAFLKGGLDIAERYSEDYYIYKYATPMAGMKELYSSMFCISAASEIPETCLDIVSRLTTDSMLRNILQYGLEDVTYYEDVNGVVYPMENEEIVWDVNPLYTGNQFILKPNSTMSESGLMLAANEWALAKRQNAEIQTSPYSGFIIEYITEETIAERNEANMEYDEEGNPIEPAPYEFMYTADVLAGLEAYSADVLERINTFEEYVDPSTGRTVTFETFLAALKNEVSNNVYVKEALNTKNEDSILMQFAWWWDIQMNGGEV